ncbi:MAG: hypothetical protein ACE5JP_08880 [Candidatus Bipolaricaulia bacterium]
MALEKELEYYNAHKEELVEHYENQFVLIKDDSLKGAFTTESEAYEAGIRELGNQPFLIKLVVKDETEEVDYIPTLTLGLINARL